MANTIKKLQSGEFEITNPNNPNEKKVVNLNVLKETLVHKKNEFEQLGNDIPELEKLASELEKIK
jgi:Tfp pilus assembly protein PilO